MNYYFRYNVKKCLLAYNLLLNVRIVSIDFIAYL